MNGLFKLNQFIDQECGGSIARAADKLGYSYGHIYNVKNGKSDIGEELLSRIAAGGGEHRKKNPMTPKTSVGNVYRFEADADISKMTDADITNFIDAVEKRLSSQRDIIATAMEKARIATEGAEKRIPALLELGRKAVSEISNRQLRKFGVTPSKSPTILTDDQRTEIALSEENTATLAGRYGVSATTVKRIRRGA